MGWFTAEIEGERFGPNRTPAEIGLFGGRYTIVFLPGELVTYQCVCCVINELEECHCFVVAKRGLCILRACQRVIGSVVGGGGDSEMTEGEYREDLFPRSQLRPRSGGRVFTERTVGTGYTRSPFG